MSSFTANGIVNGDSLSLFYGSATFAQSNVGNNIPISVTNISADGADAGNYTFPSSANTSADITPFVLNLTGSRTYDATTIAAANLFGINGLLAGVNGETLTLVGNGNVADKNTGTQKPLDTTGFSLTGNGATLASNYTLSGGIDWLTISPLAIGLTANAQDKVYDGNTAAQVTLTPAGLLPGDSVNFNYGSANFNTANVGVNKPVLITGINGSGLDAGNYSFARNLSTDASITAAILDLTGIRIYDATNAADAGLFGNKGTLTGVNGELLTLGGSGTLIDKNVGTQKSFVPVTGLNGFTLVGNNGALASNYTFAGGTDWVTIEPRPILVTAVVANKTYDGTTLAAVSSLNNGGILAGDTVTVSYTSAAFLSPNAGTDVPIVVSGVSLGGADAGNYIYPNSVATRASIFPYILDLTGMRDYNATNLAAASLFGNGGVLTGINGDMLTLQGEGSVTDKNVGAQKPLDSSTFRLTGNGAALAGNYTFDGGADWLTIHPLNVTVNAVGNDKTYDGNTTAVITLNSDGVLSGDSVTFNYGSANFNSSDAGTGIPIDVANITAGGSDRGNYLINVSANTQANIYPAILSLTGIRVYDATADADGSLFGNHGILSGVDGETLALSGSGTLVNKNVADKKVFASGGLDGFTLTGNGNALASNYTFNGGVDWVTITPATLNVVHTQTTNRPYDGTTLDALSGATLSGVLGNDSVVLGNDTVGLFNDSSVGNDKPVSTNMTLSGDDAHNYILVQPTGLTADITKEISLPSRFPTGSLVSIQALLGSNDIATPYGTAPSAAKGVYAGNKKLEEIHPLERNRTRSDFNARLPLKVVDGGVNRPPDALP